MTINHLVISGGSVYGFIYYGMLKALLVRKIFSLADIKTIHATSVGCIIGVLLIILRDLDILDTYLIDRPWSKVFQISFFSMIECIQQNGIFDISVMKSVFLPVFEAHDISIDITMCDFYALYSIELHFFSVDIQSHRLIDLSYKTHPDWTLLECIYASCCVPILFQPFKKNGLIYTDGGILCNCALHQLINDESISVHNLQDILCINIAKCVVKLKETFTVFDYILILLMNLIQRNDYDIYTNQVNYIPVNQSSILIFDINKICASSVERVKLIDHGFHLGNLFFLEKEEQRECLEQKNMEYEDILSLKFFDTVI